MFNYSLQVPSTYLNTSFAKIKGIGRQQRRKSDGRRRLYLRVLPSREHAIKKERTSTFQMLFAQFYYPVHFPKLQVYTTYLYFIIEIYVILNLFCFNYIFNLLTSQQWHTSRKTKAAIRFQLTFCCWSLFYYVVRVERYFCNSSSILYIQAISKVW